MTDDDNDVDMGINDRNVKMNIKPTIWKNIANDNHQKPDVSDNFKKYKTKTIPKNIILSKSKYDLKIVFKSYFHLYFNEHDNVLALRIFLQYAPVSFMIPFSDINLHISHVCAYSSCHGSTFTLFSRLTAFHI